MKSLAEMKSPAHMKYLAHMKSQHILNPSRYEIPSTFEIPAHMYEIPRAGRPEPRDTDLSGMEAGWNNNGVMESLVLH